MAAKSRIIEFTNEELNDYANRKTNFLYLSEKYHAARGTISNSLRASGRQDVIDRIEFNRTLGASKLSVSQIEKALKRIDGGEAIRSVAIDLDVDHQTLRYHMKKAGVVAKRPEPKIIEEQPKINHVKISNKIKTPKNSFTKYQSLMTSSMQM